MGGGVNDDGDGDEVAAECLATSGQHGQMT